MQRFGITALLVLSPAAAMAEGKMPQMDFSNPLTSAQVLWMVAILVVLYLLLSRWGLPQMGAVLENRAGVIARDLAAARAAKTASDQAVAEVNATIRKARAKAQAELAEITAKAQAAAAANAAALAERLDKNLVEAEARIETARAAALAALKPVAEAATSAMLLKLTGIAPVADAVSQRVDDAMLARKAA
jgi:F-type H+-transporting ATPase subunit b